VVKKKRGIPSSGIGDNRKHRAYTFSLTQDQKKYRVLKFLSNSRNEPQTLKAVMDSLGTTQSNSELPFLKKMRDDDLIYKDTFEDKNTTKYKIKDRGEDFLDILRYLKTLVPENPILDLYVFNMAEKEDKIEHKRDKFHNDFYIGQLNADELEKVKKKFGMDK